MGEWISVKERFPKLGQKVILFSNGVVQEEVYMLDEGEEVDKFWSRDDLDVSPLVDADDFWQPLPAPPNAP